MNLREFNIVSQLHVLLPDCAGEGPAILDGIEKQLEDAEVPGLSWSEETIETALLKSLLGRRRDALVVTYASTEYRTLCMAQDLGSSHLSAWWMLVAYPELGPEFRRALRLSREDRSIVGTGDLFAVMRAQEFATFTRHVFRKVVNEIAKERAVSPAVSFGPSPQDEAREEHA